MRPTYTLEPTEQLNVANSAAFLTVRGLDIARAIEKHMCGEKDPRGIQLCLTKPAPGVYDFRYYGAGGQGSSFHVQVRFLLWNVLEKEAPKREWRIAKMVVQKDKESIPISSGSLYRERFQEEAPIAFLDQVFTGTVLVLRCGTWDNYEVWAEGPRPEARGESEVVGDSKAFYDVDTYVKAWIAAGAYIDVLQAQNSLRKVERVSASEANVFNCGVPDTVVMPVRNVVCIG